MMAKKTFIPFGKSPPRKDDEMYYKWVGGKMTRRKFIKRGNVWGWLVNNFLK